MNNQLKLKLFDTLIRPILTYGSEVWITDYSVKDKTLDNLPFENFIIDFASTYLVYIKSLQTLRQDWNSVGEES